MNPQHIRRILSTQRFADWYNSGNFDKWIRGDADAPSGLVIDKEIIKMFLLDQPQDIYDSEFLMRWANANRITLSGKTGKWSANMKGHPNPVRDAATMMDAIAELRKRYQRHILNQASGCVTTKA